MALDHLLDPPRDVAPDDPRVGVLAHNERLLTVPTVVTLARTVGAVALSAVAAQQSSLVLLVAGLVVYWIGDVLDGAVARALGQESRVGALLDIFSDRLCAASFYIGLAWLQPDLAPAVFVYLAQFMVIDCLLSIAFVAWPIRSPNYFYVVDRRLWLWNWSPPGKAVNSAIVAVLLLVTGSMWVGLALALALVVLKTASLVRLLRLGLPVPGST
ncbi:CDP-alcohol phosphatidyltransferase family protein [Nocardioides sp. CFH 31398]|uniref:CDP-alcohol phosphatidyltransferase family protein n=1 Tax=Nocardioides sp. CFH 31398 TaxID=2919579 RepID=UPI001F059BBE|nr:CDP-alcohol phosphatidyltransferase family protein [Nocardioides sp. CFH 31398]MCH1866270.1 CDP-alcohol phosphatidyltransferase family protein [Nocardioides sp. CFH 31398]